MSVSRTFRVGVILGSQRAVRAGLQITDFVLDTIKAHESRKPNPPYAITCDLVDVATLNLPLYDEPDLPMHIHSAAEYTHEHTRSWSARVAALDAFVFVSPQYNRSIPAGLKNAIDYLYHEWARKPYMVVSYGGHGGNFAAEHLQMVLGQGLKMKAVEKSVNMTFPDREFLVKAAAGQQLGLDAADDDAPFAGYRAEIVDVWDQMVKILVEEKTEAAEK